MNKYYGRTVLISFGEEVLNRKKMEYEPQEEYFEMEVINRGLIRTASVFMAIIVSAKV